MIPRRPSSLNQSIITCRQVSSMRQNAVFRLGLANPSWLWPRHQPAACKPGRDTRCCLARSPGWDFGWDRSLALRRERAPESHWHSVLRRYPPGAIRVAAPRLKLELKHKRASEAEFPAWWRSAACAYETLAEPSRDKPAGPLENHEASTPTSRLRWQIRQGSSWRVCDLASGNRCSRQRAARTDSHRRQKVYSQQS